QPRPACGRATPGRRRARRRTLVGGQEGLEPRSGRRSSRKSSESMLRGFRPLNLSGGRLPRWVLPALAFLLAWVVLGWDLVACAFDFPWRRSSVVCLCRPDKQECLKDPVKSASPQSVTAGGELIATADC